MSELRLTAVEKSFKGVPVLRGVDLEVSAGSITTILGESGSGKTTILRLVAGFERVAGGTISIGSRTVGSADVHLTPERRGVGYVPQEGTLFPHLTVEQNVGFALPRRSRRAAAAELLALVGLPGAGQRQPHELSGGQQQRVALARALARKPRLVLLDEPFAALDPTLRARTREDVVAILRATGTTTIIVTHDQTEALSLADSVAVLRDGVIAQHAAPAVLFARPVDADLARFFGHVNVIEGTVTDSSLLTALGRVELPGAARGERRHVQVLIRGEQLVLTCPPAGGSATARIERVTFSGHELIVELETLTPQPGRHLCARLPSVRTELETGMNVGVEMVGPVHIWPAVAAAS